jgi:hypothetical protein
MNDDTGNLRRTMFAGLGFLRFTCVELTSCLQVIKLMATAGEKLGLIYS